MNTNQLNDMARSVNQSVARMRADVDQMSATVKKIQEAQAKAPDVPGMESELAELRKRVDAQDEQLAELRQALAELE